MDTGARQGFAFTPTDAAAFLAEARKPRWSGFGQNGLEPAAESFLRQIFEDAVHDESRLAPVDVLALAHEFWSFSARKAPGAQLVRVREGAGADGAPLGLDVLEVVGPDMPFLVDTIMGEVNHQSVLARAMFHPIVRVGRDGDGRRAGAGGAAESYIQVTLEPLGAGRAEALRAGVEASLADVRAAVGDFELLKMRMNDCAEALFRAKGARGETEEAVAFLRWLLGERFVFLGARDYRFPRDASGEFIAEEPEIVEDSGLGILRDPARFVLRRASEPLVITPGIRSFLEESAPIVVAKSSYPSRVHRRALADYIGIKRYDDDGHVVGETRFVGLFTAEAYNEPVRAIPLLRSKTARVLERAAKAPGSHSAKALKNIVENYPRDELFQVSEDELLETCLAILHLQDRPRPRVFVRRDRFNRFVTALAYVPKDRYNSGVRAAIGRLLTDAFGGHVASFYPELGDAPLARIRFSIQDIDRERPAPNLAELETAVARLLRSWEDEFEAVLRAAGGLAPEDKVKALRVYGRAFTAGYRERFGPDEALLDVLQIEALDADGPVRVRAYSPQNAPAASLTCKIYAQGAALPLSAMLPVLENMGLFVESETPYPVRRAEGGLAFIHELEMRAADGEPLDERAERAFEEAFIAVWSGQADNDGFNRLILKLGVGWREAALLRALARYRTQTGLDPAQSLQEEALAGYPEAARLVLALFRVRFDPELDETLEERRVWAEQLAAKLEAELDKVASLDADRALRRIGRLVSAIKRTNYFQHDPDMRAKTYLSFKIASRELEDLPDPKPFREIWVWSPEVEGVHLRFGPVARGGLRWSDRRDDFRTEVLDLVKAQQVKNAIIVPVGAKGGFFPKRLPAREQREAFAVAGRSAYQTFLRGLLDITDNLDGETVLHPAGVVRWDEDDPYLVVAADKGTATFSDLANGVAAQYRFWLGDAFASGGSVGYDHKAMGITARGAWEAVKRHFREMGRDTQAEAFSVIGVGDMSGDVFGNGMLLSKQIKLLAAFDHRDIFIDPNPVGTEMAWAERKRLFETPGSRWADYDRALISDGGGVFSRADKAIQISPQIAALTGLRKQAVSPAELMHALLKVECDLLWFGGIGSFVKAARESHAEAGDKTNDAVRVDAEELRAKVIAEGANLGVTQAGRVAFARRGGRINTDAVDNSAGVDTSDHEVNIKILLADALRVGALRPDDRVPLLAQMTDSVARLVLANNYSQTLALTLAEAAAAQDLDAHERFVESQEAQLKLDRKVEGLPGAEEFRLLREAGKGLTRPELAKLMAYAKIDLFDHLVASDVPDDPFFEASLEAYFPNLLDRFGESMRRHRLRREIIATGLAASLIDMAGPAFVQRVAETTYAAPCAIARAAEAARQILRLGELRDRINGLDRVVPAAAQTRMHLDVANALRRHTAYLVRQGCSSVGAAVTRYREPVEAQRPLTWEVLSEAERAYAQARLDDLVAAGAPAPLAQDIAVLPAQTAALDVSDIALAAGVDAGAALRLHRAVFSALRLDQMRISAAGMHLAQHWERLSLRRMLEELSEDHRRITIAAASCLEPQGALDAEGARSAVAAWLTRVGEPARRTREAMAELEASGGWTYPKIVLAAAEFRSLSATLAG